MSSSSSSIATDVFGPGKYCTKCKCVPPIKWGEEPPNKPLLIYYPTEKGDFPVLILLHGYMLLNSFYSQLLQHVASHGFIVIAPQLYEISGCDSNPDIHSTAKLIDWLPGWLSKQLPPQVSPDLAKLALSGHSRGGKTAFAQELPRYMVPTSIPVKALIGIDPVDGLLGFHTEPGVLNSQSFDINMPIMVIGTELGEVKKDFLMPACAENGMNHKDFFNRCKSPAWHFVAKNYGHMDMLDDSTPGPHGMAACLCKNGESKEPMRKFVGGIVVAFLRAYLEGDSKDLMAVKEKPDIAPVELTIDFK